MSPATEIFWWCILHHQHRRSGGVDFHQVSYTLTEMLANEAAMSMTERNERAKGRVNVLILMMMVQLAMTAMTFGVLIGYSLKTVHP